MRSQTDSHCRHMPILVAALLRISPSPTRSAMPRIVVVELLTMIATLLLLSMLMLILMQSLPCAQT